MRTFRALLSLGLGALIIGGPASVQVLGFSPHALSRPWQMYSRVGLEVCVVAYQDAAGEALERRELLALPQPVPRRRLLLHTPLDVREEARRICSKHPTLDLRVRAECSTPSGFAVAIEPSEALCPGS